MEWKSVSLQHGHIRCIYKEDWCSLVNGSKFIGPNASLFVSGFLEKLYKYSNFIAIVHKTLETSRDMQVLYMEGHGL